jgi:hypothetical protein
VDLGNSATISSISIWNRTDCCADRLNDYWVFVSDTPFGPSETPATLQSRAGTWSSHQSGSPNPSTGITVNAQGRYVRVQLSGTAITCTVFRCSSADLNLGLAMMKRNKGALLG